MELAEAYGMATRAIQTNRTSFLTLKPQNQRTQLVATTKELAKLVSAKDKAHYNVIRASSPKFSHEARALLEWKNPTGGIHVLLIQSFKTSHLCQPLQLPFQLLWPPDPVAIQPQTTKSQPLKIGIQIQPDQSQPPYIQSQDQPPAAKKPGIQTREQPQNVVRSSSQLLLQPERKQPLSAEAQSQSQPLNSDEQSQPPVAKSGHQPAPDLQPDPDPVVIQQQSSSQLQCQHPAVQAPDLPPDPDPKNNSSVPRACC